MFRILLNGIVLSKVWLKHWNFKFSKKLGKKKTKIYFSVVHCTRLYVNFNKNKADWNKKKNDDDDVKECTSEGMETAGTNTISFSHGTEISII